MIETETRDGIRILRLVHGKVSALDLELVHALTAAIETAERDRVPALVLTGRGSTFCAGVDLFRVLDGGADYVRRFLAAFTDYTFKLFAAEVPLVVAANGHAIAGGAVLIAVGDYRLMSGGRFGYSELHVGVPFPAAALEVVRFAVPAREIQALLYSGSTYPADEALPRGFIDETAEPDLLLARAVEVAQRFAAIPRETFLATKRQLRGPTLARMRDVEREQHDAIVAAWSAAETHAHIRRYLDRTVRRAKG